METRPSFGDEIQWRPLDITPASRYARVELNCACGKRVVVPDVACFIRCGCGRRYRLRVLVEVGES